jgi:PKD domain/Secretion system C-terminal sorting domain
LGDTVWHHYRRDGDYQVQLIMEASCSRDTFQVNMPIFTPLRVRLAYPKVVCEGDSVRYQYIVQSGAVTNQFWNLQNGTPNFSLSPAPVVTYRTSGKWQVKLVVQNTLNSLELLDSIVVKPRARANFTYRTLDGFIAQFTQTATHATTYRWEFGDGSVSEAPNAVHNYNGTGEFTVLLIVSNDCNRDTMRKVIQIGKTLTENLQSVNRFKLMPNPAQDELIIQLELKKAEKITFRLLNLLGQEQMKRQPAMSKTFEQSFDVSGLANGSYLLQIIGENGLMINEKVVIQH